MRAEITLHIAPGHPAFAGHFPGTPIVPGAMLLDAAVHSVHQALRLPASGDDNARPVCRISSVKFLSPVGPGENLLISWTVSAEGSTRFDISAGGRKVATGTLVFSSVP